MMHKFGVQIELEALREARQKWRDANLKFQSDYNLILTRLLNEAAANFMSAEQVAKILGVTPKQIRAKMRDAGLNPKDGKRLLAKKSAEALQENAALLGIEPHEMDLMSPLAYLPMGEELRKQIAETKTVSGNLRERLIDALEAEWKINSEAKTVDSPRGHCERLVDAALKVMG